MQSLAEFLGTVPLKDGEQPAAEPKKLTAKALSRELLNSKEYRLSLVDRIILGELPPAVECKLWDYAYGKPPDRLEVKDVTRQLDRLSAEQLEERALELARMARQLRESRDGGLHLVEPEPSDSVH